MKQRIGALVPVRLTSERLPGKALMDLCGQPVIFHLLDRIKASKFIQSPRDIVVCTTEEASDDPLVQAVETFGCSTYRGATDDIIKRFGDAIDAFGFDHVIQADGDDPLSATEYMDATMEKLLGDRSLDIVTVSGVPLGCATKSFSAQAMKKVLSSYQSDVNDTGFIYFFTKTGICNHMEIASIDPAHRHETARLTLDYPDDLSVFRKIVVGIEKEEGLPSLAEVVAFLKENPAIVEENRHVEEEYWQRTSEKAQLAYVSSDGQRKVIVV